MDFISRRKFIKGALVTTGAVGLSGHSMARERSPRKWELGMQGAKTMDCTLAEEIAITGRLGYDCLELRDWKLEAFSASDLWRICRRGLRSPESSRSISPRLNSIPWFGTRSRSHEGAP